MHLASLVEMVESGFDDRVLLGTADARVTGAEFGRLRPGRGVDARRALPALVYVGENHPLLPIALFAAAWAGIPFVPVNYRLEDHHLNEPGRPSARCAGARRRGDRAARRRSRSVDGVRRLAHVAADRPSEPSDPPFDDDEVAIVLYTSGTTSEPKSALLRHRHLMAYLLGSVEFGGAGEDEAVLVSVPPYHVAGMANMLSNLFAGRRLVYLRQFDPQAWLDTVRTEGITNAMVVPTMLSRIVDALGGRPADLPTLRSLSYGGAKVSERVLSRGAAPVPRRRLRQRLRPDRDGVDDRGARSRRPSRGDRVRRSGRSASAVVGGPGAPDGRDRDPRRRR